MASDGTASNLGLQGGASGSDDGRFVAFIIEAMSRVAHDLNDATNVLVHDRASARTAWVSAGCDGSELNGPSPFPTISNDGRFVVFGSPASNLVNGDMKDLADIVLTELSREGPDASETGVP